MEIFQETVYKYKTVDGKVFDTEEEARKHEMELIADVTIQLHNGKVLGKDDIKEFFHKCECGQCPFMVECQKMKDEIRKHTPATFTLCDVIVFSI